MTEKEFYQRVSKMETNIAVLVESASNRDKQFEIMSRTLVKHMDHEERLIERIFAKLDETKLTCDEKHALVGRTLAEYRGALTGTRWLLGFIASGMTGISIFLGWKGLN